MREITPDRLKNCKNYKKILPNLGSKIIEVMALKKITKYD
tara:strand:- start:363 stop:482 length:120 start_codon:yes stop_codon:yes gene_type:complete